MVSCKQLNIKVEKDGRKEGGKWEKAKERTKEKYFLKYKFGGEISYTHMLSIVRKIKMTSPNTHPLCFQQQE